MTKSPLIKDLQKIGFSKNVATVYLVLSDLGEAKAGEIIRRTGLHRNLVYVALVELEQKKLISKSQARGVAKFKMLDPAHILDELKTKESAAEELIRELRLKKQIATQEVIMYEGLEEMARAERQAYELSIPDGFHYILGLSPGWFEMTAGKVLPDLIALQKERQFFIKGISGINLTADEKKYELLTSGLTQWRAFPYITSKNNEITILPDRIYIKIFVAPYTTVEIINKSLADDYKTYFEFLWESKTQTLTGAAGVKFLLDETLKCADVYWIGGNGQVEIYHPDLWNEYKIKRVENKVRWHDLVYPDMKLSGVKSADISDDEFYEAKLLPPAVQAPHVICIYGQTVANIIWGENSIITLTRDAKIAEGYLSYFRYLWAEALDTAS